MKVRFMGGPMMNKRMTLTPEVMRRQRLDVAVQPRRDIVNIGNASPITDIVFQTGYYKPSKNPDIWSWVGPNTPADPYKTYERKMRKWQREMKKLYEQGVYANTVIPERPTLKP